MSRGGLGTVRAIVMLQPIDKAQAITSKTKRSLWLLKSSTIHLKIEFVVSRNLIQIE